MRPGLVHAPEAPGLGLRRARFEDVPAVLRLIEEAVEHGCRREYRPEQRRAVFLSYAQTLFIDIIRPFEAVLAEADGRLAGFAQLDPAIGRLRALFVTAELQGRGLGRLLLACVERMARSHGRRRLHGAMSLNAVPFYERSGFRPCAGPRRLDMVDVVVPVVPMDKVLPGD